MIDALELAYQPLNIVDLAWSIDGLIAVAAGQSTQIIVSLLIFSMFSPLTLGNFS